MVGLESLTWNWVSRNDTRMRRGSTNEEPRDYPASASFPPNGRPRDPRAPRLRALLAMPGTRGPIAGAFLGRLSLGMTPLATVLLVREHAGAYGAAGACAASFAATSALGAPVRGRLVDRRGQRVVLLVCGAIYAAGLLGFMLAALAGAPLAVLAAASGIAGLAFPPFSAALLALWARTLPSRELLQVAYAFDASCAEAGFLFGSLVVALVAAWASAAAATALAAALGMIGALLFVSARSSAAPSSSPAMPDPARSFVLGVAGVRTVLLQAAAVGAGVGALEIALPAFAEADGAVGRAGLLLAVWSTGSIFGGLWLGSRPTAADERLVRRHVLLALGALLVTMPLPFVTGFIPMLLILVAGGFFLSPVIATMYLLLERLAPRDALAEAFTWLTSAVFGGAALGSGIAGVLVEQAGPAGALAGVLVAAALACAIATALRATLAPAPAPVCA